MKAELETDVEIRDIAVFAELAVWEKRPDLRILCVAAQDRGALDEEAIDTVLPGLSPRARKNLCRHLSYLRLVGPDGALTDLGRLCASSGEAPAWEQGVYRLLVASHPLFYSHVLDFIRAPRDGFDSDFGRRESLPSRLRPNRDRVFASVFERSRRFSIAGFPAKKGQDPVCRSEETITGKLRWNIDLADGCNEWMIEGQVSERWRKGGGEFRSVPESVESDELSELFVDWEPQWNKKVRRLLMKYDGKITEDGRESFLRSRQYGQKQVRGFGSFDEVVVRDIPVGPATKKDARIWATAILVARSEAGDGYMAPDAWRSGWAAAIEDTPFAGRAGDAPDPARLSEVNSRPLATRTRWLLAAGADLSMEA